MPDRLFTEPDQAALYDRAFPPHERTDLKFYLPLVMGADSALDVGCGTGALLRMARGAGHAGRLVGLDPAAAMLARARQRSDIEWIEGDLSAVTFDREFDLVVMTGHAFQVLVTDDEVSGALASVRAALKHDGRFAFETRNPRVRAWESWTPQHGFDFTDAQGNLVRAESEVELPPEGDLVSFRSTYSIASFGRMHESRSTLRFLELAALDSFLVKAGFLIEQRYGDWDRSRFTDSSREIITITRVANPSVARP